MELINLLNFTEYWLADIVLLGAAMGAAIAIYKRIKPPTCIIWNTIVNIVKGPSRLEQIYKEVTPNDGSSLKDAVQRVDRRVGKLENKVEVLKNKTRILVDDLPICIVETDHEGNLTWANSTYLDLTGRTMEELLGTGWINIIPQEEREEVLKYWRSALENKTHFDATFTIQSTNGHKYKVKGHAFPVITDKIEGYVGKVKTIMEHDV